MGASSSWGGQLTKEEEYQAREQLARHGQYSRAPPPAHGAPPPAHGAHPASGKSAGGVDPRVDPRYGQYPPKSSLPSPRADPKLDHRVIPGAPAGFRADQQYGGKPSAGSYHRGPSPQHRGPSPHLGGPPAHHRGGPSPHHAHMNPAKSLSPHGSHHSPSAEHYASYPPTAPHSKVGHNYPPTQLSRPVAGSPHLPTNYHLGPMVSPSGQSDPGSKGGPPPPAHSKISPSGQPPTQPSPWAASKPDHHSPRPSSATSTPPIVNGDLVPLDLGSTKRKCEPSMAPDANLPQKSARLETLSPAGQLHRVTEPSTLGSSVIAAEATPITSVVNTAVVNSEVIIYEQKKSEEVVEPEKKVDEFKYVHKLKKAWIMKAEAESTNVKTSSSNSSSTTSPQLTRATPSPEGSTKSCSSSKGGLPSAVKSAAEALKVNGHGGEEEENDLDDFSSDNEEKPVEKPKRGRPGPKPKGKPGPKPKQPARKKLPSESDNNSESEKDSDSSKTSKKSEVVGGKKRGRKPGTKVKKNTEVAEEPKNKKLKAEESSSSVPSEPFAKPSVSQLKKTGDSFLQDASCFEVAPKLNKCRECRWSQAQRQKQSMANIFCRFYAFRRLRYTKNGQIAQAGFCDPKQDAQIEDLKLWLPSQDLSPENMDKETARTILTNLSSQFRLIYKQELEAETFAEDLTPAWKRVVQGVREMCDVCEATLFNKHWACGKCGFVVCIDCYRARVNNQPSPAVTTDSEAKDKDFYHWLLCNNNKSHQLDSLMLTQIIAGDALEEVSNRLGVLSRLGKKSNGWKSPDKKPMANGIKDETDVKDEDEADDGKSSLRDLLGTDEDMSPGPPEEREVLRMDLAQTEVEFPDAPHRWICDGTLLRLEEPGNSHNLGLFKLVWKRAQPVIVTGVGDLLESRLWQAETLANLPDPAYDPANPEASSISHGQSIKKFFDGFNAVAKRPLTDAGEPMTLKFRENWPSQEDHFAELLPAQYKDLMNVLPLPDYTSREGRLNLAARLPECFVRLDLGPRMWGGYSKATFNLQYNVADAVHLMTSRGETRDLKGDLADVIQSTGCDEASAALALEKPNDVGAIWHIFHPSQADKIKDFVMKNSKTDSKKKPKDPLWVGHMYLKERLLEKLETETSIRPWTFLQSLGEAVIIPAGAPYQVKVLNSSLFCQSEFVSPEQMRQVMRLSFTDIGQQFDDRLQVKNVVFHSCKDALSILERPDKEEGGK